MRIEDLDEFEGLTADMVRGWLRARGYEVERWGSWQQGDSAAVTDALLTDNLGTAMHALAHHFERSEQSLLREINPRMRPGWPTEGEIEAHGLDEGWLMRDDEGVLRTGYFRRNAAGICFVYATEDGERWTLPVDGQVLAFWPCDAHGNKVRRGTVA